MRGCRPQAPVHQICRNDTKRLTAADMPTGGIANNRLRAYIEPHNATKPTLLMKFDNVKASKILGRRSKAKLVEWVPRESSRGTRYAQVELKASKSEPVPTRASSRIKSDESRLHTPSTAPSMDVDEAFWTEEPVLPKKKRASFRHLLSQQYLTSFSVTAHLL
jgi:hypothetical protein